MPAPAHGSEPMALMIQVTLRLGRLGGVGSGRDPSPSTPASGLKAEARNAEFMLRRLRSLWFRKVVTPLGLAETYQLTWGFVARGRRPQPSSPRRRPGGYDWHTISRGREQRGPHAAGHGSCVPGTSMADPDGRGRPCGRRHLVAAPQAGPQARFGWDDDVQLAASTWRVFCARPGWALANVAVVRHL